SLGWPCHTIPRVTPRPCEEEPGGPGTYQASPSRARAGRTGVRVMSEFDRQMSGTREAGQLVGSASLAVSSRRPDGTAWPVRAVYRTELAPVGPENGEIPPGDESRWPSRRAGAQ